MADKGQDRKFYDSHQKVTIKRDKPENNVEGFYIDPAGAYGAYHNAVIDFYHVATKKSIAFKSIITSLSDSYSTSLEAEEYVNNIEKVYKYKGTERKISLSWEIVASSENEARGNLQRITDLANFTYPKKVGNAVKPPIVRMKFLNLIGTSNTPDYADSSGLFGYIESLTYDLNSTEIGFYKLDGDPDDTSDNKGTVIAPKKITAQINFTIIHQETPGYIGQTFRPTDQPYGVGSYPKGVTDLNKDAIKKGSNLGKATADIDKILGN